MIDLILSVLAICMVGVLIGLTISALLGIEKCLRKIAEILEEANKDE